MSASPTDRYRRVDAVFDALLDVPPDEQMAFAERAAGDDPEVHAEVLRLLHAHRREGFLESPLPIAGALLDTRCSPSAAPPSASAPGASSGCSAGAAWGPCTLASGPTASSSSAPRSRSSSGARRGCSAASSRSAGSWRCSSIRGSRGSSRAA